LTFNGETAWELDSTTVIKPMAVDHCLPSDCRYREDSVALGQGDLDLSQAYLSCFNHISEKERLEELQRADRRFREEAAKRRGDVVHH